MKTFLTITRRSFIVVSLLVFTAVIAGAYIFINGVSKAEIPDSPGSLRSKSAITIYYDDGKTVLGKLQPPGGVREVIDSRKISPYMKDALIAAEDSSFRTNPGFAPQRIASAALGQLSGNTSAGGASGITQQLVKNTLVGDEVSLDRKWREILSATKLTAAWDKDDIISAYLNTVYFGRGALGIEKAAQAYFGVHASELNMSQSALLAGIIQSPSAHDPAVDATAAKKRFEYVKNQLHDNGMVSDKQYADMKLPQTIPPKPLDQSTGLTEYTGHLVSQVLMELNARGYSKDDLFDMGANIVSTVSLGVQNNIVDKATQREAATGLSTAVVSVDNATGAVKGMWGGGDGLGFNYAENPQNMTGSSFKVFTLAAALDSGAVGLNTPISSDPYQIGDHTVNNSDGMSCGTCSVAEATKQSLNTSFYRIIDRLPNGPKSVQEIAHKAGVNAPLADSDGTVNHSITLGVYGTTMEQLAHGFSTLINGGVKHSRHYVDNVKNRNNQLVYRFTDKPSRAIKQSTSEDMKKALAPIADYSNNNGIGRRSYSKTGTTEHPTAGPGFNRDGIMVGGDDKITTAVWFGTKNGDPIPGLWGAGEPAGLWSSIMRGI